MMLAKIIGALLVSILGLCGYAAIVSNPPDLTPEEADKAYRDMRNVQ